MAIPEGHPVVEVLAAVRSDYTSANVKQNSLASCAVAILSADVVSVGLTGLIVTAASGVFKLLGFPDIAAASDWYTHVAILFAATTFYLAINGRYSERIPFWAETKLIFCASCWAVLAEILVGSVNKGIVGHLPAVLTMAMFPFVATIANVVTKYLLMQAGTWRLPVLLIGSGDAAIAVEEALASDTNLGYSIVGRIDPEVAAAQRGTTRLASLVARYGAQRLLFVLDGNPGLQRQLIDEALRERVSFTVAPEPNAYPAFAGQAMRFFSHDVVMLSFRHGLSRYVLRIAKIMVEMAVAAFLLMLLSPIFLVVALLNIGSGGPVFFAHRRIGIGGKPFYCLKFRTMVVDADRVLKVALAEDPALAAEWEASHKLRDDPRVTPVGSFLRKTSLDELPQLFNVLRREMSLVGPRPIVDAEVRFYGEDIAHYYSMRPGITGLWQVSGRSNTSYRRRVQLDVWYVNNWTIWLDIAVLLKTVPAVLARRGAH